MEAKTQRLHKIIVCDIEKCNGCGICEYVCSVTKEKVINPKKSRIRVLRIEPFLNIALACRKCEKPTCERACPKKAVKVLSDGSIVIDKDKCDGCGWCIETCEFGAMRLHLENRIVFACDFCNDLGGPQCVEYCPKKALKYTTLEQAARDSGKEAVKMALMELMTGQASR